MPRNVIKELQDRIPELRVDDDQPGPGKSRRDASDDNRFSLLDLPADADDDWPDPIDDAAFYGPAGDFVRETLPETEADAAALLLHFLVFASAMMGRARFYSVGGTSHHARLFAVAVGGTATGRKGTALDCVTHLFRAVEFGMETEFCTDNVVSGLTSGAGLVWNVRDAQAIGKETDPGIEDKRLLAIESELGGVLRVCSRKENDLSAVIRDAWDGKNLRTLAKTAPARATNPHICIIGHVTREELRATLNKTDVANGFANRILWYCSRRSKLLPDGGRLYRKDFSGLAEQIRSVVEFAHVGGRMDRSDAARELWHDVYGRLTSPRPGVFGQVTTRAEAQTLRLSMLYALLDESDVIDVPHLHAALAVWNYCQASARWAFGGSLGNQLADDLLAALREVAPAGLSSTDINGLFSRNRNASDIRQALGILSRHELIRDEKQSSGRGRPKVTWYAT